MFSQCYRVIEHSGVLVAIVMSYDWHVRALKDFPELVIDHKHKRLWDEEGWQCSFSQQGLEQELHAIGFAHVVVEPLVFQYQEVFDDIERLYGIRLPAHLPLEELFVVGTK